MFAIASRGNPVNQAYELLGFDGKTHTIWAISAKEAHTAGNKWASRHGGLESVSILAIHDPNSKDCWKLARRFTVDRSSDALAIAQKHGAFLDKENCLRYHPTLAVQI